MSRRERSIITKTAVGALLKRSVYGLVGGVALYHLYLVAMPGSWFLNYTQAQVTQAAFAGESVSVEFCRDRKTGTVDARGTRTFYRADSVNGPFEDRGSYEFTPNIENNDTCVNLPIKSERFKHDAGFWYFHTDLNFDVNGYEKTSSYQSNVYQVRPQPTNAELQQSVKEQIDNLQRQLDELRDQAAVVPSEVPQGPIGNESPRTDVARTETPTTSSPPPEQPVTPTPVPSSEQEEQARPGLVPSLLIQTLTPVLGLMEDVL